MPRPKHRDKYSDKHLHQQQCWHLLVYYRAWPKHNTSTTCETIVIKRKFCRLLHFSFDWRCYHQFVDVLMPHLSRGSKPAHVSRFQEYLNDCAIASFVSA